MSSFNLDRFRYDKRTAVGEEQSCFSRSPDSEKENKPGEVVVLLVGGGQMFTANQPDVVL